MENNQVCPICGCKEIGHGKHSYQGCMYPLNGGIFSTGSEVIADICTNCGHILSMRVEKPEKFKTKK
jgi:hypothetical protein